VTEIRRRDTRLRYSDLVPPGCFFCGIRTFPAVAVIHYAYPKPKLRGKGTHATAPPSLMACSQQILHAAPSVIARRSSLLLALSHPLFLGLRRGKDAPQAFTKSSHRASRVISWHVWCVCVRAGVAGGFFQHAEGNSEPVSST
jgi:hypothetical protein